MLLLHFPNWRILGDVKGDHTSWIDSFNTFLASDVCPNFVKADVERAKAKKNRKDSSEDIVENEDVEAQSVEQPDWVDLIKPSTAFDECEDDFQYNDGGGEYDWSQNSYSYPSSFGQSFIQDLDQAVAEPDDHHLNFPLVDLKLMNQDQKFAFDIVMYTLYNYTENNEQYAPLRMVVSGTAGSGKSFLIKCLVKDIKTLFQSNKSVQVLCPTGNSANIISGVTLHSFLKVPTYDRSKEMTTPDGYIGEALQSNCDGLQVLLVDERSMIGATTLGWMEFMCKNGVKSGENNHLSWGGLPVVVFFGDDVQLPPVLDSPVYLSSSKLPAAMHGVLVWKEFETAVLLKSIIRQGDKEQQFRSVLMSLREYKLTSEQAKWLQNFQWHNLECKYGVKLLNDMIIQGLFVFPTHDEVWNHNKKMLLEANKTFPIAKLNAETKGPHSKTTETDKAGGLLQHLFLCPSAKVMLSVNVFVSYGLFNSAIGKIVDIIYLNGKKPPQHLPDVVMVEFESYTGPAFIQENPKLVPIVPVERRIDCSCRQCKRKQIPLRLGWATTIHRCQGMTIGNGETNRYIIINPGTRSFESRTPGALFVALSRAKTAGNNHTYPDFAWHQSVLVNEDRLCHIVNTATVRARSVEIDKIKMLSERTNEKYSFLSQQKEYLDFIQRLMEYFYSMEE